MRYKCADCGWWVKDKFIFGLLHVCSPLPEERASGHPQSQRGLDQLNRAYNELLDARKNASHPLIRSNEPKAHH